MPDCVVPGCARDGRNNLSVRLRRPDTSAIWAPNTEGFVCDVHAESGARVVLYYETTSADEIEVVVHGVDSAAMRTTPIRHKEDAESLDGELRSRVND
jgi:hypothetical protein